MELKPKAACISVIQDKGGFMTIEQIKAQLKRHQGQEVKITFDIGRNKKEIFKAIISELYPSVFIVLKDDEKKAFSYVDVLTNTIMFNFK